MVPINNVSTITICDNADELVSIERIEMCACATAKKQMHIIKTIAIALSITYISALREAVTLKISI